MLEFKGVWHDAKLDPPKESGEYVCKKKYDQTDTWHYMMLGYSCVHKMWNCRDWFTEDVAKDRAIDGILYWTEADF